MSIFNIKLHRRKKIIRIEKIIRREPEFMIIQDKAGVQHKISETDIIHADWERINVGTVLVITIRESVAGIAVLSQEFPKSVAWKDIPVPGYMWYCEVCNESGVVGYEDGDNQQVVIDRIYKAHTRASSDCDPFNVQIVDHHLVKREELRRIVALGKKK